MNALWNVIFYKPLYNALAFLVSAVPFHDLGIAVILLTILVKIILFPLSKKAIVSQVKLKAIEPKINKIKEENEDKQMQAQKTFALYKEEGVNPFSGCLVLLLQLPIIFALYKVFLKGISQNSDMLYSFVHFPVSVQNMFIGLINMSKGSILLAILAGLTQYLQLHLQNTTVEKPKDGKDMQAMIAYSMNTQMKYIVPIMITFVSLKIPAAVSLYWVVSNVITILQERSIRKNLGVSYGK